MNKNDTLKNSILQAVQHHNLGEQKDLQKLLKEKGHHVPQATLSRYLKKLNIVKIQGYYKVVQDTQFLPYILGYRVSDHGLVVLHTHPGQGSYLAYFLDKKYVFQGEKTSSLGILGTIGGDDTVLVVTQNTHVVSTFLERLSEDFPYLSKDSKKILQET